jgi:PAS domain S-box-containing protein
MTILDLIQAIFAGFCAYAFVTHATIGLRSQPRDRVQLSFAVLSLFFGAASVAVIFLNQGMAAGSAEEIVYANRWSLFFTFLAFATLIWFIFLYTGVEGRFFPVIFSAVLVAISLSNFLVPYPGTYAYYSLEVAGAAHQVATGGLAIDWTPWYRPVTVSVNALFAVYAAYCARWQYRRGERSQAIVLMIALSSVWAASLWDVLLVETGLVPVILMTQNGIIAFMVIMSLRLSGQVVKAEQEARRLNVELEQRVGERTIELSQRTEALQRSEERYALAQRAANIGSWDWNVLTGDLHWSEQVEPMFGFGPGEFGRSYAEFLDCVHPEDRQFVIDSVNVAVEQDADYTIEHRIVWPDGSVRWVAETGDVLRDEAGQAVRMVGAVRDVTSRREAEAALRERTEELGERIEELSALNHVASVLAATVDPQTVLASVAETIAEVYDARMTLFAVPQPEDALVHILAGFEQTSGPFRAISQVFSLDDMPNTRRVLEQGQSIVIPNVQGLSPTRSVQALARERNLHTLLLVPLRARGTVHGVLTVGWEQAKRALDEGEISLAETIAADVASVLENARLAKEAQTAAVDAERQRLARALHDSVTQSLYSLTLLSNGWGTMAEQGRLEDPAGSFRQVGQVGQQALKEMRLLIHQLRPPILEEEGLIGALQYRLEAVEQRASVETHLHTGGDVEDLGERLEEELFHIAQEALNNALRHASASEVVVTLRRQQDHLILSVEDNGVGFDTAAGSAGIGLDAMRERAEAIGGIVDITSLPGEGTRVEVKVALGAEKSV